MSAIHMQEWHIKKNGENHVFWTIKHSAHISTLDLLLVYFAAIYENEFYFQVRKGKRRFTLQFDWQKAWALWVHMPWQKTNTHSSQRHARWNQYCMLPSFLRSSEIWWWLAKLQIDNRNGFVFLTSRTGNTKQSSQMLVFLFFFQLIKSVLVLEY